MPGKLLIIWDFDTAIGQINSTMPYNFRYDPIYEEIENVDYILNRAHIEDIRMTFACVGFAGESGVFPFNIPDIISKISIRGHEIASHSWKHEWFPYLNEKQIYRSLERSKQTLESCLGPGEKVSGFVPPHSRPMSWLKKYSVSLGDRGLYPFHKGSDIGYIIKELGKLNYRWCRVLPKYKPVWEKIKGNQSDDSVFFPVWETHDNIVCVPSHYNGFDKAAIDFVKEAVKRNETAVISGHPAGLSRDKEESREYFDRFIDKAVQLRDVEGLEILTVQEHILKNLSLTEKKTEN